MGWSSRISNKNKPRRFLVDVYFNEENINWKYIYYGMAVSQRQAWYYGLCEAKTNLVIEEWIEEKFDSKVQTHNNYYDTTMAGELVGYYLKKDDKWCKVTEEIILNLRNKNINERVIYELCLPDVI